MGADGVFFSFFFYETSNIFLAGFYISAGVRRLHDEVFYTWHIILGYMHTSKFLLLHAKKTSLFVRFILTHSLKINFTYNLSTNSCDSLEIKLPNLSLEPSV